MWLSKNVDFAYTGFSQKTGKMLINNGCILNQCKMKNLYKNLY